MSLTSILLLIRIAGYSLGVLVSLCIVVPMSLQLDDYKGNCFLFAFLNLSNDGKASKSPLGWASCLYCYYVLAVGVLIMAFCCLQARRLLISWLECKAPSFLATFLEAAACLVLCGLAASAGVVVTLGYTSFCQSVTVYFPSCEDFAGVKISGATTDWINLQLETLQVGSWAAFATLVGLGVGSMLQVLHYHRLWNDLAVGRDDERQPLLNSGFPTDGSAIH